MKFPKLLASVLLVGLWVSWPGLAEAPASARPKQAAIASANAAATDAGMKILAQGGNAVDAAIAVSSTLGLAKKKMAGKKN